ncbi:MAG: ACT domain-containing protein [Lachnospiraceae bacterium]|nr:ACT domain-containing protein [Lachnospiraceae bacterium]
MAIRQLSVFVENKPGALVDIVAALAQAKIDIRAMSVADTNDFGILRLIVSDVEATKEVLSAGYLYNVTDVVAVEMKDESGALSGILNVLGAAQINLEYMYAFTAPTAHGAYVVLRVADNEAAQEALTAAGFVLLSDNDAKVF